MSHAEIMRALSGLLLGMFAAVLSSTIVTNALPRIIADLGGGQSAYTWVITATLLAMTASMPLWGKLADLFSKKLLIQCALVLYAAGSVVAGLAQSPGMLITVRAVQGIGVGGLAGLAQIIMAAMIAPRERGRYNGYLGATFAAATVSGPLIGGLITDTPGLGWRWCFFAGVPFSVVALVVLQRTLRLPVTRRAVRIDWLGALLVSAAVSLLLVWVTLAGDRYPWLSWQTAAMTGGAVLLGLAFVVAETRASEPIIPLRLFRDPTIALASFASLFVGIAMFSGTVFFSQFFQLADGRSPTLSGVMTIPLIGGMSLSSTVSGLLITRTGRWKYWLVAGGTLTTLGLVLLGTVRHDTPYAWVAVFMALMGLGVGMLLQNLVLVAQNRVGARDLGATSSVVAFFRSFGGALGVAVLGAVLAARVSQHAGDALGPAAGSGGIPDPRLLPEASRVVIETAYGRGVAEIFLCAAPAALAALLLTLFIRETRLRSGAEPGGGPAGASVGGTVDDTTTARR
ncbi:MDR family MFS transporter [Streptomyces sp. B6B3]|uniref:MDR family MFS transporter n=1 Tax=Streptomyces sp. B6B3 TaxID=3153570 RepID=UPI00325D3CBA